MKTRFFTGLLLGAWLGLGLYVWLTSGGLSARERTECKDKYERGSTCLIVRVGKP